MTSVRQAHDGEGELLVRRVVQRQRPPATEATQASITLTERVDDQPEVPLAGLASRRPQVQRDRIERDVGLPYT